MSIEATASRDRAVSLFNQGMPAAEVWETLVSSGVEQAAAEALVKEILEERRVQIENAREEEEQRGSGFCKKCYAESTWRTPGNISTINGTGSTFYGRAERCEACGSVVRVLWYVLFGIPIVPQETYRYRDMGSRKFIARRTETRPAQVATHLACGLGLAALSILIFIAFKR